MSKPYSPLVLQCRAKLTRPRAAANTSDIDLFIYGLDSEEAAIKRIVEIEAIIRKNQRLASGTGLALRSENAITFISPKYPHRHIQVRYNSVQFSRDSFLMCRQPWGNRSFSGFTGPSARY